MGLAGLSLVGEMMIGTMGGNLFLMALNALIGVMG
jgi:hypothetical protein